MTYLVYQAYGSEEIAGEALFSILSLIKIGIPDNTRILVYTDKEFFFRKYLPSDLSISYISILTDQIKSWRGKIDFVHRVKVEILINYFNCFQNDNLLYLDSDTWFLQSPSHIINEIGRGNIYMHLSEGSIESRKNPIFKKLYKFLKANSFTYNGKTFSIPLTTQMWNAGVIGIASNYKETLSEVLSLTDQLYARYQKHVMEQLAFSYVLAEKGKITAADNIIYHYWNFKEYRKVIAQFLSENSGATFSQLIQGASEIAPFKIIEQYKKPEKKGLFRFFKLS